MCLSAGYSQSSIVPVDLTCEYRTDPVGLDVPRPRLGWVLKAADDTRHGQRQSAYRIFVSHSRASVDKNTGDMWDSGWIASDEMQQIEYKGKPLQSDRTYFWKVAVKDEKGVASPFSKTAQWSTGLFTQEEWTARWIGASEVYDPAQGGNKMYDPWFRKSFNLKKKPARGTLFVASVGYHEVYVNGRKIDHPVLEPAVTDHTKRARYLAYDIAPALQPGKNVIGLWLGTSWSIYAPYVTSDKPRTPIVVAQADIYNTNGERMMRIATDESWKTHPSPNKLTGNWGFGVGGYGGEIWDANKEIKNWNTISLDDRDWKKAIVYHPRLTLSAQQVETNRLYEVPPAGVEKRSDGSYRVDMGVNFAGWVQ
ncbi:MAG TPA: alpha-L-rhamnosidase, partial [Porphyromonadaceae bacterium]|nr:alpha-L-rhamnosidase [Porphyromonadaceae bacterium]